MPNFQEQKRTLDDCRRLLDKYGKCMLIRPTGFGKTYILTELIKAAVEGPKKKALYLYPSQVIRDTVVDRYFELPDQDPDEPLDPETAETYRAMNEIPGCVLMTYAKLIRLGPNEIDAMGFGLVVCDEAHRMGGAKTKAACDRLFAALPADTAFIGATATPTRMDNFDVSSHFFSDRLCYPYTLHDAVSDRIIPKPNYCYATYDFRTDLEDAAMEAGEDLKDPLVQKTVAAKLIELGEIFNMPRIIRETCDRYVPDTSYMKFIVFFANKAHMSEKLADVEGWFHNAYPDHEIRTLRISTRNREEKSNTDKLDALTAKPGRIDLIACIDMLNMGYHVSDQTGILMYRGTKSNTIFTQQLGRALSAGADSPAIIFDIVDNLHRKGVYELYVKPSNRTRRSRGAEPALDNFYVDPGNPSAVMAKGPDGPVPTQYHVENGRILDKRGNRSTLKLNPDGSVSNSADAQSEQKDVNRLTKDCLNATGHEASYREILAKAMVEPLSHRCKYALQIHFNSWCARRGIEYPITEKKLAEMYGMDMQDFYDEFRKVIADNKIAYPLHDAQELLKIGEDGDTDAPLAICCEATGVSVQALLDLVFQ